MKKAKKNEIPETTYPPEVVFQDGAWGILLRHTNGGSAFMSFTSKQDAEGAVTFARICQHQGIRLHHHTILIHSKSGKNIFK